jgi:hypothetical protein
MFYQGMFIKTGKDIAREKGDGHANYRCPELEDFDLWGQPLEEQCRVRKMRERRRIKWLLIAIATLVLAIMFTSIRYAYPQDTPAEQCQGAVISDADQDRQEEQEDDYRRDMEEEDRDMEEFGD